MLWVIWERTKLAFRVFVAPYFSWFFGGRQSPFSEGVPRPNQPALGPDNPLPEPLRERLAREQNIEEKKDSSNEQNIEEKKDSSNEQNIEGKSDSGSDSGLDSGPDWVSDPYWAPYWGEGSRKLRDFHLYPTWEKIKDPDVLAPDVIVLDVIIPDENSDALVPDENLLAFGLVLFFISLLGILFNKQGHFLIVMLFFELMLYSLSFTSIIFSLLWGYPQGQIFALLIMSVAVAESSIGLGILITVFRSSQRIDLDEFSYIKA